MRGPAAVGRPAGRAPRCWWRHSRQDAKKERWSNRNLGERAAAASDPEIKKSFAELNAAGNDLRALVAKLDQQVQPSSDKLIQTLNEDRQALATFNAAAASAQHFIQAQTDLGSEAGKTLEQLREAAASVQRLADFLERNPNAIITGRKPQ